jgi:hypothetical protein
MDSAPYYEFSFPREAVTEIWIGPRNPDHPNVSGQHLRACAGPDVDVPVSRLALAIPETDRRAAPANDAQLLLQLPNQGREIPGVCGGVRYAARAVPLRVAE